MKIAILGSGGREHALANQIKKSKKTDKIYCIPGNAGTGAIGENININLDDFNGIYNFVNEKQIDLVVVGPEKPLVEGISDFLKEKKIKVFGPSKKASQFEKLFIVYTIVIVPKIRSPDAPVTAGKFPLSCSTKRMANHANAVASTHVGAKPRASVVCTDQLCLRKRQRNCSNK